MTVEPIVAQTAQHFGVDARLIQAVIQAEGDILKAVRCSIPSIASREDAIRVTCRSALHALHDFHFKAGGGTPQQFVQYWAHRWAPVNATNDPHGLNQFWPLNVTKLWLPDTASVAH